MRRKKDYRETLGNFQIHTKDGVEKFLCEVANWYQAMYPARFDFFRENLRRLREINKNPDGSYTDDKGREWRVTYRVPSELLLFVQRWIPTFGQDSADIDTMVRVWCDLVKVGKDRRRHTRLTVTQDWSRRPNEYVPRPRDEAGRCEECRLADAFGDPHDDCPHCRHLRDDHREELRQEPRENARVASPELPD